MWQKRTLALTSFNPSVSHSFTSPQTIIILLIVNSQILLGVHHLFRRSHQDEDKLELNKWGTLSPDNLMWFLYSCSLLGFCQYISREIFLGLLEIVANLILEQGDGTTNLFKIWIPANFSDILITHWNCYPFFCA